MENIEANNQEVSENQESQRQTPDKAPKENKIFIVGFIVAVLVIVVIVIVALVIMFTKTSKSTSLSPLVSNQQQAEEGELAQIEQDLAIRVLAEGDEVFLNAEQQERLLAITLELFSSCTGRTKQMVREGDWQQVCKSGSCVHAHFAQPRVIDSPARPQTQVSDILVSLGDGGRGTGEVWVRDGATYYSPFIDCEESLRLKLKQVIIEDA